MQHFCGSPEALGDGTPALKLGTNRPLIFIRDALTSYSKDEIWAWIKEAYFRWTEVADLKCERIASMDEAQGRIVHLITVADLGTSGVLADQQLPYVGGNVLTMRINSRLRWKATDGQMDSGTADPIRTLCHEIGHNLGFSHFPAGPPADLMEPYLSQTVIRPQASEAKIAAEWFGQPVANPDRPPTIPSAGTVDEFVLKKIVIPGYKITRAAA